MVGKSEANALVSVVEDGVVLAHEDITQDPERTSRSRDIKTNHAEKAQIAIGDEVVLSSEGVDLAIDGEVEAGEGVILARDHVLAGNDLLSTDGSSDLLHDIRRTSQQRGTRVNDGLSLGSEGGATNGEATKGDLPVGSSQKVDPRQLTSVLGGVRTAQSQLTEVLGRVAEVEGELRALDEALLDKVLEGSGHVVNGQDGEGKAEDTIELAELVSATQTGSISDLGEDLILHNKAAHVEDIGGLVASHRTGAVLDVEGGTVLDVGG